MPVKRVLTVWLLSILAGTAASRVLELTEENYDKVIEDTPLILVEFYAPW